MSLDLSSVTFPPTQPPKVIDVVYYDTLPYDVQGVASNNNATVKYVFSKNGVKIPLVAGELDVSGNPTVANHQYKFTNFLDAANDLFVNQNGQPYFTDFNNAYGTPIMGRYSNYINFISQDTGLTPVLRNNDLHFTRADISGNDQLVSGKTCTLEVKNIPGLTADNSILSSTNSLTVNLREMGINPIDNQSIVYGQSNPVLNIGVNAYSSSAYLSITPKPNTNTPANILPLKYNLGRGGVYNVAIPLSNIPLDGVDGSYSWDIVLEDANGFYKAAVKTCTIGIRPGFKSPTLSATSLSVPYDNSTRASLTITPSNLNQLSDTSKLRYRITDITRDGDLNTSIEELQVTLGLGPTSVLLVNDMNYYMTSNNPITLNVGRNPVKLYSIPPTNAKFKITFYQSISDTINSTNSTELYSQYVTVAITGHNFTPVVITPNYSNTNKITYRITGNKAANQVYVHHYGRNKWLEITNPDNFESDQNGGKSFGVANRGDFDFFDFDLATGRKFVVDDAKVFAASKTNYVTSMVDNKLAIEYNSTGTGNNRTYNTTVSGSNELVELDANGDEIGTNNNTSSNNTLQKDSVNDIEVSFRKIEDNTVSDGLPNWLLTGPSNLSPNNLQYRVVVNVREDSATKYITGFTTQFSNNLVITAQNGKAETTATTTTLANKLAINLMYLDTRYNDSNVTVETSVYYGSILIGSYSEVFKLLLTDNLNTKAVTHALIVKNGTRIGLDCASNANTVKDLSDNVWTNVNATRVRHNIFSAAVMGEAGHSMKITTSSKATDFKVIANSLSGNNVKPKLFVPYNFGSIYGSSISKYESDYTENGTRPAGSADLFVNVDAVYGTSSNFFIDLSGFVGTVEVEYKTFYLNNSTPLGSTNKLVIYSLPDCKLNGTITTDLNNKLTTLANKASLQLLLTVMYVIGGIPINTPVFDDIILVINNNTTSNYVKVLGSALKRLLSVKVESLNFRDENDNDVNNLFDVSSVPLAPLYTSSTNVIEFKGSSEESDIFRLVFNVDTVGSLNSSYSSGTPVYTMSTDPFELYVLDDAKVINAGMMYTNRLVATSSIDVNNLSFVKYIEVNNDLYGLYDIREFDNTLYLYIRNITANNCDIYYSTSERGVYVRLSAGKVQMFIQKSTGEWEASAVF